MMLKQLMDGGDDGCNDDNVKREEHVEESQPPFPSHDASTKQSSGVGDDNDAHARDDGAESSSTSHFVEEKQLMDGGNRFDVERDENNEESQLPLLLHDTSTK